MMKEFVKGVTLLREYYAEPHKRCALCIATTIIVAGTILGYLGMHGLGVAVEVIGLYLVAMI